MILPRKMTESLIKYPFANIDHSCCTQKYWKDHWFGKKQNPTWSLGIFSKSSILALSIQLKRSLLDLQPVWKDVWWIDFQNRWSQSTAGAVVSRTGYQTYKTFGDRNAQILQNIKKIMYDLLVPKAMTKEIKFERMCCDCNHCLTLI